jgi:hypothetical protein
MSQEPSLETALAWMREGVLPTPPAAPNADRDRLAERVAFARRDYPEVFELLLDVTLRRAAVDYRLPRFEALQYATLREGQNSVAAVFLDYLTHHERLQNDRSSRSDPGRQPDTGPAIVLPAGDTSDPDPDADPGDALFGAANRDPFARV